MKTRILFLLAGLLLAAGNAFAAGDLIVNGNLGVGTTAPAKKLDVTGDINFTGNLYKNGSLFSGGGGTGYSLNAADGTPTNAVYVNNDGKVGIGTTNPAVKLDVTGSGGLNTDFQVNGRLKSNSNDGGLWVSSDRFVGGFDTNKIGFWSNGVWRVTVLNNGNVGIGDKVDPGAYKLKVAGTACATAWQTSSDVRFKEDFAPVEAPLDKVLQMNGLSYTWKTEEYTERGFPEGRHYGVIAQEIEKVLPEVVQEDADGMKSVSYTEIIPVLIEAIKEQQKQINELKLKITELEK